MESSPYKPSSNRKLTLAIDARLIIVLLVLVIAVMTAVWQPWRGTRRAANDRTIQVTGQATVKEEPDEYQFSPYYEFKDASKDVANKSANDKSAEVVTELKKLSVEDKHIKTSITNYGGYKPDGTYNNDTFTYTLAVSVVVNAKDQAQRVQDYLNTTSPQGVITPYATFSESKRKQVEATARDDATKDARSKAEQSAKNLGFKIGDVKVVEDGQGFGGIAYSGETAVAPMPATMAVDSSGGSTSAISSVGAIMPGQNDLSYSVTVTYYLR